MPDQEPIRRALLRAAHLVLLTAERVGPAEGATAEVGNGRWRVRVELLPGQQETAGGTPGGRQVTAGIRLTSLDRDILEAARGEPKTMGELARACDNHDVDSYFRGRVRRLKRAGRLTTDGQGRYRLP